MICEMRLERYIEVDENGKKKHTSMQAEQAMWRAGGDKELGVYRSMKWADVAGTREQEEQIEMKLESWAGASSCRAFR